MFNTTVLEEQILGKQRYGYKLLCIYQPYPSGNKALEPCIRLSLSLPIATAVLGYNRMYANESTAVRFSDIPEKRQCNATIISNKHSPSALKTLSEVSGASNNPHINTNWI
jgi:hypothetical protein